LFNHFCLTSLRNQFNHFCPLYCYLGVRSSYSNVVRTYYAETFKNNLFLYSFFI
jgi:hypothetical protein